MNVLRLAAACAIFASALAPAMAHVTLAPAELRAGTVDELTFRCPNERPAATTTKLVIQMPENAALTLVKVRPVPGWNAAITMRKLAAPVHGRTGDISSVVDTITWSGGIIRPSEYQDFAILAGPMPHRVGQLAFKALQTYSNGEIVRWIEERNPGEAAPAHPAPVVHITP